MDFVNGFEPSEKGRWTSCAVVCDRFSCMTHFMKCSSHPTTQEAADIFIQLVVRAHRVCYVPIYD